MTPLKSDGQSSDGEKPRVNNGGAISVLSAACMKQKLSKSLMQFQHIRSWCRDEETGIASH